MKKNTNSTTTTILSHGGGVDSTAILCIVLDPERASEILGRPVSMPHIDAICFADPGSEFDQTYVVIETSQRLAADAGIPYYVVRHKTDTLIKQMLRNGTIPLFPGKCGHSCSRKYKGKVQHDWAETAFPGQTINWLIGIEANETNRSYQSPAGDPHQCKHPLVDLGLTRDDCLKIVEAMFPVPVHKSSCYFCPFMQPHEIRDLHDNYPHLWAQALEIEETFRATSPAKYKKWIDAGKPRTKKADGSPGRAPTRMWREDSWAQGHRLFARKIDGQRLSMREWAARFANELAALTG